MHLALSPKIKEMKNTVFKVWTSSVGFIGMKCTVGMPPSCQCFVCTAVLDKGLETRQTQPRCLTSGLSTFVQRSSRNSSRWEPNICASPCEVPNTVLPWESGEVYLDNKIQKPPVSRRAHLSCCSLGRELAQASARIYIPIHMHWVLHT